MKGSVVIITGASRGLGRAMALALGKRGATVVVTARPAGTQEAIPESLNETVELLRIQGSIGLAVPMDVRDENQVKALVTQVLADYGKIDVLVNNAGLMVGDVPFIDTTTAIWQDILATNLWGTFLCCRAVLPTLLSQGYGTIVNITSGAAVRTGFLNVPYGVSKAGIDRLTLGLGAEFKGHNIACVSLSPPLSATQTVLSMYPDRPLQNWAKSPDLTALALTKLLADDNPMNYSGKVLSVSEYLANC